MCSMLLCGSKKNMGAAAKKIDTTPEFELLNLNKLALRFDLDRATVRKRLELAKIEPVAGHAKEKIYELTPRVYSLLSAVNDPLAEVKLRAATADAQLREAKVALIQRTSVPIAEVNDVFGKVIAGLHRDCVIQTPKRLGPKLARVKTAVEATKMLKQELDKIFRKLKDDPEGFLK